MVQSNGLLAQLEALVKLLLLDKHGRLVREIERLLRVELNGLRVELDCLVELFLLVSVVALVLLQICLFFAVDLVLFFLGKRLVLFLLLLGNLLFFLLLLVLLRFLHVFCVALLLL